MLQFRNYGQKDFKSSFQMQAAEVFHLPGFRFLD